MSAVSDAIVREYFESLGFLVTQPRKYQVIARSKRADEEMDLLAYNPNARGKPPANGRLWNSTHLRRVSCAVVGIRGWHTDRFSPSLLELSPEVFRFAHPDVVRQAGRLMGRGTVTTVLCVPALPADPARQARALAMLHERGVQGVISFRTVLLELAAMVDTSRNYERSDLLQILRILKNYGLLNDAQLELFGGRRARRPRHAPGGAAEGAAPPAPGDGAGGA